MGEDKIIHHRRMLFLYKLGIPVPSDYSHAYSVIFDVLGVSYNDEIVVGSTKICRYFKKDGKIVYTENRDEKDRMVYMNKTTGVLDGRIILHIDLEHWNQLHYRIIKDTNAFTTADIHELVDWVLSYMGLKFHYHDNSKYLNK